MLILNSDVIKQTYSLIIYGNHSSIHTYGTHMYFIYETCVRILT